MYQTNAPKPNGDETPRGRLAKVEKLYTVVIQLETTTGDAGTPFSKEWFHIKDIVDILNEQLPEGLSAGLLAVAGGHMVVIPAEEGKLNPRTTSDTVANFDRAVIREAVEKTR